MTKQEKGGLESGIWGGVVEFEMLMECIQM